MQAFLLEERALIDDPSLPISSFNYSAIRDRLRDRGFDISLPTIIDRAKNSGVIGPIARFSVLANTAIGRA